MPAPVAGEYWLVHPTDASKNVKLSTVIDDSFTDEWEESTLLIIGKGRKKDYGTRWGYTGSLVAQIWDEVGRTSTQAKAELELLKEQQITVILWTPFGEQIPIAMGNAQISRMAGVGTREFHTLTLPYEEITPAV